jgi:hypothetical protein
MRTSLICRRSVALVALAGALSLTAFAGTAAAGSGAAVPISTVEGALVSGTVATYATTVTTNDRFVAQAYADILGRSPSAQDAAFAINFLDQTGTRQQLASVLLTSDEYRAATVHSGFVTFLRRDASAGEVSTWTTFLKSGGSDEQFKAILLGSAEYFAGQGGGTNDGFLNALFLDVLGRTIDPASEQLFTQALATTETRADVALDVLTSTEARQDLVAGFFEQFLHRSASPAEVQAFTAALAGGATDEDVIASLVGSGEYFASVSSPPVTIDWGDGTPATVGSITGDSVTGSHTYSEEGTYPVTVTVTDIDGTFTFDSTATVTDAPLSAASTSFSVAKKTDSTETVATFTDANPAAGAGDFAASIDWGDGQTSSGVISAAPNGGFAVDGNHRYDTKGSYQVTVQVQDAGGATVTAVSNATVGTKGSIKKA